MSLKNKEGYITQAKSNRGRKKLPAGERKEGKRAFLHQRLIDWLIEQGNGNFSVGVERVSRIAGYKEENETSKPVVAHGWPSVEAEPPMCVAELSFSA